MAHVEDEITVPRLSRPVFVTPSAPAAAPSAPTRSPPGDRPSQESSPWLVQLELTTREFALFRGSELTRSAVAWREGMPEWRPLTAIDAERQWQQMADSAPPPAMAISEPPRSASKSPAGEIARNHWPHSAVVVALVALAAMLLLVWWGPVQTARDAALRAELAVQRLAPIVERVLVAIEARAAEANRAASVPAGGAAARSLASSAPQVPASVAPPPPSASAAPAPVASAKSAAMVVERAQLARALSGAVERASSCASGASGSLRAIVTFGPNGLVRAVSLGPAPSGVDRGCVSKALSSARGRPYEGEPITIKKTLRF